MKTPSVNSRILKLEVLKDTATRTSVNAVESRTTSLESDVATAQGDISTLQTDVSAAEGNISTLQTDVSAAEGNISTLQGDVTTLTQEIVDARNAGHAALSNVLPSAASQNHLTDDELEFFGTLPSTISDLMSNVEEVDADFVSISYNPSGASGSRGLYSGLMSSDAPTQANTGLGTWYNQGSCTLSEHAGGLTILNPTLGASYNTGGLYRAAPAAPWVLTTLVSISCPPGNYPAARLGFIDTTTGRTSSFGLCANGTLYVANFSAPSSWAGDLATVSVAGTRVLWLRLSDDGSSLHFSYSWDGVNFVELYSVSRSSAYAGYTHIFFGASSLNITAAATLLSWSIS